MEEDYEELIDDQEDEFEQSQDISDGQLSQYESTYPQAKEEQSKYNWFWKVVNLNKPFKLSKVGNLTNPEIGPARTTMRDSLSIANLGHTFHHHKFGNFWATNAKIISATSMAKNGWLVERSITQTKERTRKKSSSISPGSEKWRLFNKKKETTGQ